MKRPAFALSVVLLVAGPANGGAGAVFAQGTATGFPPFGSFQDSGFDAVNRQNLNVNFAIPLVTSPGRSQDFTFSIVYDSLIWRRSGNAWTRVTDENGNPT